MTSHITQNVQDLENLAARLLEIHDASASLPRTVTSRWYLLSPNI